MKTFLKIIFYLYVLVYPSFMAASATEYPYQKDRMIYAGLFPNNRPFSMTHNDTVRMVQKRKQPVKRKLEESWEYRDLIKDLKKIISISNTAPEDMEKNPDVFTYWQIGQRISKDLESRKNDPGFPAEMYTCLERDLPMEKTTLEHIVLFYQCHEIVASISKDLSWEHYVILIRITDDKKRRFYHDHAIKHLWSANILKKEIADGLYEKSELISPGKPE